ncbi:hypothetical protein K1719_001975 [Acacia pycnantha]|nr:hypothetical protein K1719_001975 [Acacia pycnantha]
MDKSWIKMPRSSPVYLAGLNTFLDFAFSHARINGKIPFPEAYTFWEVHGEQRGMRYGLHLPRTSQVGNQVHQDDPVNEVVLDAFGVQDENFTPEVQGPEPVFFRNDAAREFFSLMDESDHSFDQGCQKYSKLSFLIKLYHIKSMCGITDKAMSMFLELLRDAFPDANIPSSFYEKTLDSVSLLRLPPPALSAKQFSRRLAKTETRFSVKQVLELGLAVRSEEEYSTIYG